MFVLSSKNPAEPGAYAVENQKGENGLLKRTKVSASKIVDFPAPFVPITRLVGLL